MKIAVDGHITRLHTFSFRAASQSRAQGQSGRRSRRRKRLASDDGGKTEDSRKVARAYHLRPSLRSISKRSGPAR